MAVILGSLRPEATNGEKLVLDWLKALPDRMIVWPELAVGDSFPDFVLFDPSRGILVLEVKDWVEIIHATPETMTVRTRQGETRQEPHPARATRHKATVIANKLQAEPRLQRTDGPYAGRLKLPWAYAVVLANLTRMFLYQLGPVIDECPFFCLDDLQSRPAHEALGDIRWRFQTELTAADVDAIRGVLFPELVITSQGRTVGTADFAQEQAAKEGLFETAAPADEDTLPEMGQRVAVNPSVRLIRGVVGSGKTLVLVMRAKHLAAAHPDWRILVVTFNRPLTEDLEARFDGYRDQITVTSFHRHCRTLLDGLGEWGNGPIDDRLGRVAAILSRSTETPRFEAAFLAEEIGWMKEMNLTTREAYLREARVGRGKPLSQTDREWVWEIFEQYRVQLNTFHRYDWEDVPLMVAGALEQGMLTSGSYDAILVDEAQDFAPAWFDVLRRELNPRSGVMFLSADGVQRIYRKHSWRAMGLNVIGRTRVLNRSYRSTYEIAQAAYHLIRSDEELVRALEAEGEDLPPTELDPGWMRHGEPPSVRFFPNPNKEKQWLVNRVRDLVGTGYRPSDMAIFHYTREGAHEIAAALRRVGLPVRPLRDAGSGSPDGVALGTMHAAKGLEFPVVFVAQLDSLFMAGHMPTSADEARRQEAERLRLLYVAVTRAREKLYLCYANQLPARLSPFIKFVREMGAS